MRYYILITLKDNSHVEAEFNTSEEVDAFLKKYEDRIIPYATEFFDREKIAKQKYQEGLGKMAMVALGLITLYFMFR